jgi:hypothetical protein
VGKISYNIWILQHTQMDIYPAHVYIFTIFQMFFDSKKWSLTSLFIYFLPNVLEHSNIFHAPCPLLVIFVQKQDKLLQP